MKILYLAPQRQKPGQFTAHSFIDEEIRALHSRGIEGHVLTSSAGQPEVDGIRLTSVNSHQSASEVFRTALRVARYHREAGSIRRIDDLRQTYFILRRELAAAEVAKREQVDIIHSHFAFPGGLGGSIGAREAGVPLVATLRGTDLACDPELDYGLRCDPRFDHRVRHLLSAAEHTTYFSDYMRNRGIELGARPETATTIRKGVDLEQFSAGADADAARRRLNLSGPVILSVCGLLKLKGVDLLLECLARLRSRQVEATLVLCGEGRERANLEELAIRLGVRDRVRFEGRIPRARIPDYFAAADVFVLASRREAAGNVVLEAMASARPVVCTASGGPQEYVVEGETAFVVPVDDCEALAQKIAYLLGSAELRQRMGRAGRLRAEQEFPYGRMVEDMLNVYRQVRESGRGREQR